MKKKLMSIAAMTMILGNTAIGDCYFIRMNGYHFDQGFDLFGWGQISPLISLEAGDFYNLSPNGQDQIDISGGKADNLQGELLYIPKSLIKENSFALKMIVIERDIESPDDLLLPLSEKTIPLKKDSLLMNSFKFNVDFHPFGDPVTTTAKNKQSYSFEIIKDDLNCDTNTTEGRKNDRYFRLQNRLKRLRLHIKLYENAFLSGGQEYRSYYNPVLEGYSLPDVIKIAESIAAINSDELIRLGTSLEKLQNIENFKNVWREYIYLIYHLLDQNITIKYYEDKKQRVMFVPSLRFHPDWQKFSDQSAVMPPKRWKINLGENK